MSERGEVPLSLQLQTLPMKPWETSGRRRHHHKTSSPLYHHRLSDSLSSFFRFLTYLSVILHLSCSFSQCSTSGCRVVFFLTSSVTQLFTPLSTSQSVVCRRTVVSSGLSSALHYSPLVLPTLQTLPFAAANCRSFHSSFTSTSPSSSLLLRLSIAPAAPHRNGQTRIIAHVEETQQTRQLLQPASQKDFLGTHGTSPVVTAKEAQRRFTETPHSTGNYCYVCGAQITTEEAVFCSICGSKVDATTDRLTLRRFVEETFLPVRLAEVGHHTARVEKGFWKQILEEIGTIPLAQLSSRMWEQYLWQMKKRGCCPRTQVLHQVAYSAALRYAVHTGHLVSVHPLRTIRGSTKRKFRTIPLTAQEVQRLLDNAGCTMYRALFGVSVGIGLRPSEAVRMRWEDIDLARRTVKIRGTKTTGATSAVPITNLAHRTLDEWWKVEHQPLRGLCFYVKKQPNGEEHVPLASFRSALRLAAQRGSLQLNEHGEPRRIFPYLLRHSFATLAASCSPPVPLPVAQAVMRHTSSKMLLETYAKAGATLIRDGLKNFNV